MRVSRRRHHRRQTVAELNVTAFMNLMVVLVPFLLITAVFSRLAILELSLPVASDEPVEQNDKIEALQMFVFTDAIELTNESGLIQRFERDNEAIDYTAISEVLKTVKTQLPKRDAITLLFEQDTPYDVMVQLMDTARETLVERDGKVLRAELFPQIAIGDAVATPDNAAAQADSTSNSSPNNNPRNNTSNRGTRNNSANELPTINRSPSLNNSAGAN